MHKILVVGMTDTNLLFLLLVNTNYHCTDFLRTAELNDVIRYLTHTIHHKVLSIAWQGEGQLTKFLDKLKKADLLIIDELGYVQISNRVSQLMFQIFSERYEKGSILVNTNLEFAEWANIFHDERMTCAILDRLIHNSKIVLFNGESYRYRAQQAVLKEA